MSEPAVTVDCRGFVGVTLHQTITECVDILSWMINQAKADPGMRAIMREVSNALSIEMEARRSWSSDETDGR